MASSVKVRCPCGAALVVDEGVSIRYLFGQWRIFKDTGKVVATCRRCPIEHVIEPGRALKSGEDVVRALHLPQQDA